MYYSGVLPGQITHVGAGRRKLWGLCKTWLKTQHRQRKPLLSVYPEGPLPCPAWGTRHLPGCSHELYFPRVLEGGWGEALLPHKPWLAGLHTPSQRRHLEEAAETPAALEGENGCKPYSQISAGSGLAHALMTVINWA